VLHGCTMSYEMDDNMSPIRMRESQFDSFLTSQLEPFWQEHAVTDFFVNDQKLHIHYAKLLNPAARQAVVVSPGRVEGYLKYKELAYDLYHQGYSVFIIDHQGQGLSSRRLSNAHKGHVAEFQDYINDFSQLISDVVKPSFHGELYLLAHSMGCAIGLRYVQQFPDTFKKASFSSPMWGFLSGAMPDVVAKSMVWMGYWLTQTFAKESAYFFGGTDYEAKSFTDNELTGSEARYQYFRNIYQQMPELQLGSITFSWLKACITGLEDAYEHLDKIRIPIQVLQAEDETVIDNRAQNRFCQRLAEFGQPCFGGEPLVISGAKHELFIESDDKRQLALEAVWEYFNS